VSATVTLASETLELCAERAAYWPRRRMLLVDRTRNKVSSEKLADRIKRMQLALERAAG